MLLGTQPAPSPLRAQWSRPHHQLGWMHRMEDQLLQALHPSLCHSSLYVALRIKESQMLL